MDFLDIRKKAKERAKARGADEAAAETRPRPESAPGAPRAGRAAPARKRARREEAAAEPGDPPVLAAGPVVTDEDLIEGALAARLQGLPAPAEGPPAEDGRFTTWRPGAGAPPALNPEPVAPVSSARPADFTVFGGPSAFSAPPAPVRPPPFAAPAAPKAQTDPLDDFFYDPAEAAPSLPQIASSAPMPQEEPAPMVREEYLTFLLGAEEFAVAVPRVREVIRAPPITDVPRAPGHILGVVTVRGEVVAVLDPRRRLGLPEAAFAEGEGKVVIVDAGEGPCGLLVDRVASVVRLPAGSIEPCPQGIAGQRSEYLTGIGRAGERLFTVLDVGALLRRAPVRADAPGLARRSDAGA